MNPVGGESAEVNHQVGDELRHIPIIKGDLEQNLFRSTYGSIRRHDLTVDPEMSASVSFKRALEHARATNSNFSPAYDKEFFQV